MKQYYIFLKKFEVIELYYEKRGVTASILNLEEEEKKIQIQEFSDGGFCILSCDIGKTHLLYFCDSYEISDTRND